MRIPRIGESAVAATSMGAPVGHLRNVAVADLFGQLDVDRDGRVSRSDAAATGIPEEEFAAADLDGDGFIDFNEFSIWLSGSTEN